MMAAAIRELCLVSVLCGAAMSLSPEGGVRKIMSVLCMAVLLLSLISPLSSTQLLTPALQNAKLRQREAELSLKGSEINQRLSRLVIEEECEAYIMDKAAELSVQCVSVKVEVRWSSDGLWVPWSASISAYGEEEKLRRLESLTEAELGIPGERQYWSENE